MHANKQLHDDKQVSKLIVLQRQQHRHTLLYRVAPMVGALMGLIFIPLLITFIKNYPFKPPRGHRGGSCLANMRVLEGAVDMWEMDTDGRNFPSGVLIEESGLVPNYVKRLPRCRRKGVYHYNSQFHEVYCTTHGSVDQPIPRSLQQQQPQPRVQKPGEDGWQK